MEPTFAAAAAVNNTVTAELQSQLAAAVAALPPSHCLAPTERELSKSKEAAFTRLQDWAFTKGFALAIESSKTKAGEVNRVVFQCVHHRKKTRNTRKISKVEQARVETKTQTKGCRFSLYVSKQKRLGG